MISPVTLTPAAEEIFKRMNIEASININGVRLNLRFQMTQNCLLKVKRNQMIC